MGTLKEMLASDKFAAMAGVELIKAEEGYALTKMLVTEKHLNGGGVCQGGALFTLADLAFAAVANSRTNLTLSINANITFLRSVSRGYVYAEATEVCNHSKVPFVEVRIYDEENNTIAVFTSSGYRKNVQLNLSGLM